MSIIGPPLGIGASMRARRAETQAWRGRARKSRDARSPGYPGGGSVGVYAGPPRAASQGRPAGLGRRALRGRAVCGPGERAARRPV